VIGEAYATNARSNASLITPAATEPTSRTMTLAADEFMRRFLIHVLPPGFQRMRHCGLLANRHRKEKLALCRRLLRTAAAELLPERAQCLALLAALTAAAVGKCPVCGVGEMRRVQTLPAYRWPARPPDSS